MDIFIFHREIQAQVVELHRARDVVVLSFKCHKSLEYLDLSSKEHQFLRIDDIRLRIQPDREILYKYHLDLPADLERFFIKDGTISVSQNAFHVSKIYVHERVYTQDLEKFIVEAIRSNENKTEKLIKYINVLGLLNFNQYLNATVYLYENLPEVLCIEDCRVSSLVMHFVLTFNFVWWLFSRGNPQVLAFVLHHAHRIRCTKYLWRFIPPQKEVVVTCLLQHRITCVRLLLMYGTPMILPCGFDFGHHTDVPCVVFYDAICVYGIVDYRRAFLIFQLIYDFLHHRDSPEGLRCIWYSIRDPFLNRTELYHTLIRALPSEIIDLIIWHYSVAITGTDCSVRSSPRTLEHLCRVEIREFFAERNLLPSGIFLLNIPETMKSYLTEC